jgi:phosphoheptose isomerase
LSSLEHSTCFNLFNSLVTLEAALTIVSCWMTESKDLVCGKSKSHTNWFTLVLKIL